MSLRFSQQLQNMWGSLVLRVFSKNEFCALAPDFFINNFRLPDRWEEGLLPAERCAENSTHQSSFSNSPMPLV
jgi:hypothetical protein